MTDKIIVVTPPDDTPLQGIRIAYINLTPELNSMVSNALLQTKLPHVIINYIWKMGDSVEWLLDKVPKTDLIIFNASLPNNGAVELITGWIAAQPQSYYFGNLRDLHKANNRAIYSVEDILTLLENIARHHE
jgi:hypothetical protein